MRPIKFRVWDEMSLSYNTFPSNDINLSSRELAFTAVELSAASHQHLEQFTGLLDKNGKEIYEGDIVRTSYRPDDTNRVNFHDGAFQIAPNHYPHGAMLSIFDAHEIEVVGNIHENPDKLRGDQTNPEIPECSGSQCSAPHL